MSTATRELWLIRHGETVDNAARRWQGWRDAPLSTRGHRQARSLAAVLEPASFDTVGSSDLQRAVDTAASAFGKPPTCRDRRLRELHFGKLEGRSLFDMDTLERWLLLRWVRQPLHASPPDGETLAELLVRVGAYLRELAPTGRHAIVAHGGSLRAILALTGLIPYRRLAAVPLRNASITVLREQNERWTIVRYNDVAHDPTRAHQYP